MTENERILDPKLRMIANGSFRVNRIRSELASSIRIRQEVSMEVIQIKRAQESRPVSKEEVAERELKRVPLEEITGDVEADVFLELSAAPDISQLLSYAGSDLLRGNILPTQVPLSQLEELSAEPSVLHVQIAQPLKLPKPFTVDPHAAVPGAGERRIDCDVDHRDGQGVLIGIIDVNGFDFTHPDFLENEQTRFVSIWDQGGDDQPAPTGFSYGTEITQAQMNDAIREGKRIGVPPYRLAPQSQMISGSHGTHVASIAAGNNGVCSKAFIVGVLIALNEADLDRRKTFCDSVNIAHAIAYILGKARELEEGPGKPVPVSINISLGTNGHAHDGSAAISRWMDAELANPGRCVCVAAGNAGQEKAETQEDIGFVMGRIHTAGVIPARGLVKDIEWVVVGNGIADISENELEIWYSPQDRFSVSVKPPGLEWTEKILPGQYIENRQLEDGSFLSIYNELYYTSNGANYISIYLSPFFGDSGIIGVRAGKWMVRLHGEEVRDGSFHGWIERDDPRRLGRIGDKEAWNFPSFFSSESNVDNSSINSLACGNSVLVVANMDTQNEKISITSSQGPTRDGRQKPEVAAPGTNIVAAKGFSGEEDLWLSLSGTSMASPYVCGLTGLMLSIQPNLTAAQIIGIIMHTSRPGPGYDYNWQNDAGFGLVDPTACLQEAESINSAKDITK